MNTGAIGRAPRRFRLRLCVYLTAAFSALAVVSGLSLYAHAAEAGLAFGAELARLGHAGADVEALLINGQQFHYGVMLREGEPSALLDRLQAACERAPGPLGEALIELADAAAHARVGEPARALRRGVLRQDADDRGMLACFMGEAGGGLAELLRRLAELARTGSVGALSHVQYAYVERSAPGQSRLVLLWTDGGLEPGAMFPITGDAPGSDPPLVPRPPASRRLLSASAQGAPFVLLHYASRTPAPELLRFYAARLPALGFQRAAEGEEAMAYQRDDGRQLFLSLVEQGTATHVTLIEAGAGSADVELTE